MAATSLQQWARRYMIRVTHIEECSPHKRARIHYFLENGLLKFGIHRMVGAILALVHLSLFLFFAGLVVYLSNINHAVFTVVICWVALLSVVYGFTTFMPFIWLDSPYYTPLTSPAWFLFTRALYLVFGVLCGTMSLFCTSNLLCPVWKWAKRQVQRTYEGTWCEVKEAVSEQSEAIDYAILTYTLLGLDEDGEHERVLESIPGFFKSNKVKLDLLRDHARMRAEIAIRHVLHNTLSPNSLHESVKIRRLATCFNTASEVLAPDHGNLIGDLIEVSWGEVLHSAAIGHHLRSWDKGSGGHFTPYIQGIVAALIASVRTRDESWATLARDHLGVPEAVFHDYQTHGDSVLLANLIHFARNADLLDSFTLKVVRTISKFDAGGTLPELRRDFCGMWNDLVQQGQNYDADSGYATFLEEIRQHYITLHPGTDPAPTTFPGSTTDRHDDSLWYPSSYPLCNIPINHPQATVRYDHDVPAAEAVPWPPPASTSLHHDSVLTTTEPFLLPSSYPDDTITKPKDQPTIRILPSPVILSSFPAPPVVHQPSPSLVTPPDPAVSTSAQATGTVRHPSVSSAVTLTVDHHTLEATISTPHLTFPPLTDGTIAAVSFSPPMVPVVLFSPFPPTFSSNVPLTGSMPCPMPSPSRSTEAPSGEEIPHLSTSVDTSPTACKSASEHGATVPLSAAMGDPSDDSI